ncbi:endophilin-A3a isoform X2 [Boleophthalmus pectinirostris]|uniref:endophilin-A3a isoform X2 n=1 Tax=Boleophthalmus pectinirostris TaxID=150288 RepID=UPI000A1C68EC|nr:endophilin-A3a isoform X2 [Boleophthalmus pectinirostris]
MSVAGLKKQFHKASQLLSEKISGAEGTKLDEDFQEMERKIEVTNKSVLDLLSKTTEYLQPNPASRAKLNMLNTVSKIRGQVKTTGYPQAEGLLGDCMLRYGHELGEDSVFGLSLVDMGEAMRQMADVKDSLDINVKQNFIDPLQHLQDKDLKEIMHHLKKLEGRRLDFDYKKKRQGKIPDEEIRLAVEKFDESRELAERSMFNFLESDVEQVSQLAALIEAALEYHKQSSQILEELSTKLQKRISTANTRPRKEFKSKSVKSSIDTMGSNHQNGLSYSSSIKSTDIQIHTVNGKNDHITSAPESWPDSPVTNGNHHRIFTSFSNFQTDNFEETEVLDQPCCRSLYDFEPENEGELGFKEGDIIILTNQIDDNWYEGMIHGESGFFPINYVQVLVPLPQ